MHGVKRQFLLIFPVAIYDYNRKHYIESFKYTKTCNIISIMGIEIE